MRHTKRVLIGAATLGLLGSVAWLGTTTPERAEAADHNDPPDRVVDGDRAADIADLYAWTNESGKTVLVLTYAGPVDPSRSRTASTA